MSKLDDILRKVQNLLNQADHPNTAATEAATFRAKAEALMLKYRIEEAMLSQADPAGVAPVWRDIYVGEPGEFAGHYLAIFGAVMRHLNVRGTYRYGRSDDGRPSGYIYQCVGYEGDLRFAEALFTSARVAFSKRLEPTYDPELSDQVNAYFMRSAGWEGRRIALAIYGSDARNLRPKVREMFKREAIRRGEDPTPLLGRGVNVKTYRASYAQGFVSEFGWRLKRARMDTGEQSQGLVLAGAKERVDEAFYERFPNQRPRPIAGEIGNPRDECAKCAKAKSGYCREHSYLRPRAYRGPYLNQTAAAAGASAAREVDLGVRGRLT